MSAMKKLVCVLLCCLLLPAAVFAEEPAETAAENTAAEPSLMDRVLGVISDGRDLGRMYADDLSDLLGIEPEDYTDFVYLSDYNALTGREVILLLAADGDAADRVEEMLGMYLEGRLKETRNYLPEAYKLLSAAEVVRSGLVLVLVVGENSGEETAQLLALVAEE